MLTQITPNHLAKGTQWVTFKCVGSGFGNAPEVISDNPALVPITYWGYHVSQDSFVVGIVVIPETFADSSVMLRVRNGITDITSNALPLFVDEPDQDAPFGYGIFDAVQQGGEADGTLYGRNLDGVTELSFSGIPGLHFSNVQSYCCGVSFHVRSDPSTPLTGNDVTNLTITTANGRSNPFMFGVY